MEIRKVVTLGEVLMRLSTATSGRFADAHRFDINYGGSEANVSVALASWGIPSKHITRFPDNELGIAASRSLRQAGVDLQHCTTGVERMPLYFFEPGSGERSGKVIYDRFDSAFSNIGPGMVNWDEVFRDASWFHWGGITPALSSGAMQVCLEALNAAKAKGLIVSADINYRRNLWRYGKSAREVMPGLMEKSSIWIAGEGDMANCLGISSSSFEDACKQAGTRFSGLNGIGWINRTVVSSTHHRIQGLWWNRTRITSSREMELNPIVDRIGSGDAFAAGLIYGHHQKWEPQQMIDYATAACALKHTMSGDVLTTSVEEVSDLARQQNIGKLLR
ncbi:MAG TPA: sugar kinase [Cyclobacteriaceae bacterium]|nr:sugar kinase [Cyclobacteriaceae bacterium]